MSGWVDRWIRLLMDGLMDRWVIDEWVNGCMKRRMNQ